jgi:hypothetical protein
MTMLRIRKETEILFHYPSNVVRIVRPEIAFAMNACKHHFANRHKGPEHRRAARNWAEGVKKRDANSGYSTALAQTLGRLETPVD